jgi:tRNA A37 threonylcarbamoyladenosine biosynthesis protein TsaE
MSLMQGVVILLGASTHVRSPCFVECRAYTAGPGIIVRGLLPALHRPRGP